jgi:hypothetical protein
MEHDGCPNASGLIWEMSRTGERRPRVCRSLACEYCGPRLALSTANAIVLAAPEMSAVLTTWGPSVPTEPEALFLLFARTVNVVARDLRGDGEWEYVWTLELSEAGFLTRTSWHGASRWGR